MHGRGLAPNKVALGIVVYFDEDHMKATGTKALHQLRPWHIRGGTSRPYVCIQLGTDSDVWAPLTTNPDGNAKVPSNLKRNLSTSADTYLGAASFSISKSELRRLTENDTRSGHHRPTIESSWLRRTAALMGLVSERKVA